MMLFVKALALAIIQIIEGVIVGLFSIVFWSLGIVAMIAILLISLPILLVLIIGEQLQYWRNRF